MPRLNPEALTDIRLEPGSVALIGGGPGAWDLLTVRGLALLQQADVVVVDRLGPAGITELLEQPVEVIGVGKAPGAHSLSQESIGELLVQKARAGHRVVRLKGGDPFVLGRGGEEVMACQAADVPVQVVPGVTSAIAGPAAAGIPVTHRGTAVAVHVVNAHGDLGPADLAALRDPGTTTVLLMGVAWLPRLVAQTQLNGIDPATPVAVVQNATLPEQREVRGTLGTIVQRVQASGIGHPAVIVVGRTAVNGFLSPAAAEEGAAEGGELQGSGRQALAAGDDRALSEDGATGVVGATGADGVRTAAGLPPVLIGCAHGTRSREGRDVVRAMLQRVAAARPDVPVREAYVDVQEPAVEDAVARWAGPDADPRTRDDAMPRAVVVPLLLSTGYHVGHDIAAAVTGQAACSTGPLGPDPRLAQVMAVRLTEAGAREEDAVVMAAAGTRDAAGQDMARHMAQLLAAELGREVTTAFIAAADPLVAEAVASARAASPSGRVALASYLLSPGHFQSRLDSAGADVVAAPLGDHPLITQLVLDRYDAAVGA